MLIKMLLSHASYNPKITLAGLFIDCAHNSAPAFSLSQAEIAIVLRIVLQMMASQSFTHSS